jgi:hypothetical protein
MTVALHNDFQNKMTGKGASAVLDKIRRNTASGDTHKIPNNMMRIPLSRSDNMMRMNGGGSVFFEEVIVFVLMIFMACNFGKQSVKQPRVRVVSTNQRQVHYD